MENAVISKAIPLCIRKLVVRDVQTGESHRAVARKYKISKAAVGKILPKLKTFGSVLDRPGKSRKRKTDARTDTKSMREIKKNPKVTVPEIQGTLQLSISGRTVRRRLVAQWLNSKVARKHPFISRANKAKRLKFAKEHTDKPVEYWKMVLWTDESKFELFNRKRRVRVQRRSGEELQERHIQGTVKHGGGNVMVWGCFSWGGVGSLVKIDGIMTVDSYINILRENLEVSLIQTGLEEKFIFQQDNDCQKDQVFLQVLSNQTAAARWNGLYKARTSTPSRICGRFSMPGLTKLVLPINITILKPWSAPEKS